MKALTVRNPWALAIFECGKDIENRDWYTGIRGTVAIHAGKGMTRGEYLDASEFIGISHPTIDQCLAVSGMIIGTVDIVDCVTNSESQWFFGKYGFVLRNPVRFDVPVPAKGALGFWEWKQS